MRLRIFLLFLAILIILSITPSLKANPDVTHEVTEESAEVAGVIGYANTDKEYWAGDNFTLSISSVSPSGVVENSRAFNFSDGDYIVLYRSYHYDLMVEFGDPNDGEYDEAVILVLEVNWTDGWVKAYLDGIEVVHGIHGSGSYSTSNEKVYDSVGYGLRFGNFTDVVWQYNYTGSFSSHTVTFRQEINNPVTAYARLLVTSGCDRGYMTIDDEASFQVRYSVETGGGSDILTVDVDPATLRGYEFEYRELNMANWGSEEFPHSFNLSEIQAVKCRAYRYLGEYGEFEFIKWKMGSYETPDITTCWIWSGGTLTAYYNKWAYVSVLNVNAYDVSGGELKANISYTGDFTGLNSTPFKLVNKVNASLGSSAFTVTFKALPLEGYRFIRWVVRDEDNSTIVATYSDTVTVTVPNDRRYLAEAYYERVEPTEVYVNAVLDNGTKLNVKVNWNLTTTLSEKGYEGGEYVTSFKLDFSWLRKYVEVHPGENAWISLAGYLTDPLMWSGEEWVYVSNSYDYAYAYLNETFIGRTTILISKVRVVGAYGRLYLLDGELNRVGEYTLPNGLTEDYSLMLNLNDTRHVALGGYVTYGSVMWQNVSILSVVGRDLIVGNLTLKYPTVIERNGVYYVLSDVKGIDDNVLSDGLAAFTVLGMHKYNITLVYSEFNATENNVLIIARLKGGELLNVLAEYTINYSIGLNITGSGLTPILIDKFNNVTVNRPISLKATEWDSVNCRVSQLGNKLRLQSYVGAGGYAWYTGLTVNGPALIKVMYAANGRGTLEPALINISDNSIVDTGNILYLPSGEAYLGFKVYGTWTVSSYKINTVEYGDGVALGSLTVTVPCQLSYLGITYNLSKWHGVDGYDGNKAWLSLISGNNYIVIVEYGSESVPRRSFAVASEWYCPEMTMNATLPKDIEYPAIIDLIVTPYFENSSERIYAYIVHPEGRDYRFIPVRHLTLNATEWYNVSGLFTFSTDEVERLPTILNISDGRYRKYIGWKFLTLIALYNESMYYCWNTSRHYRGFDFRNNITYNVFNVTFRWFNGTDVLEWNKTVVVSIPAMKVRGIYDMYGVTVVMESYWLLRPPVNVTMEPVWGDIAIVAYDSEGKVLFKALLGSGVNGYYGVNGTTVLTSVYLRHDYLTFEKYWDRGTNLTFEYRWLSPSGKSILTKIWGMNPLAICLKPLKPWIVSEIQEYPLEIHFRLENRDECCVSVVVVLWNGTKYDIGTYCCDEITVHLNVDKRNRDAWIYFIPSETSGFLLYVPPIKV